MDENEIEFLAKKVALKNERIDELTLEVERLSEALTVKNDENSVLKSRLDLCRYNRDEVAVREANYRKHALALKAFILSVLQRLAVLVAIEHTHNEKNAVIRQICKDLQWYAESKPSDISDNDSIPF